ncbi:hypothetical protein MMIC_P1359 [Mariprofundus micogutta]|uniref:Dienelactone hydrolase domain-containing protein n=1 Tax=Mariprofundus micogutta TaxID=1921010 RepID=A0A1L8CNC5_9PROT|nr:dienelactone hydrolase family protein [Mariprofundus micogutta]GAV20394.1 hypothetical protein MMIC_P1359 [Mariprofundus micogutta]
MYKALFTLLLCLINLNAYAGVQGKEIIYQVGDTEFTGFLAFDDAVKGKRPGILVLHEWWGHNAYARKRAEMLAALGYTAFALDMYGTGKLAAHPEDAKAFMMAVTGDKVEMVKRFQAGLKILTDQANVDRNKIAAIGYCMGGGMALNMARSGIDLDVIVVFHGSLGTETPVTAGQVKAEIMVFTGAADPFVPTEQVQAFEQEMKSAGVVYTLKSYPGVKHSFTNPDADGFAARFKMPLAYNRAADEDSWQQMLQLFQKVFRSE